MRDSAHAFNFDFMRKTIIYICALYMLGMVSCETKGLEHFDNLAGAVIYRDSLRIQDDGFSFISMRNPILVQDSILGFGDNTFRSINIFHSRNGSFLMTFERDSVDSFILPVKDMSLFDVERDTVYILNNLVSFYFRFFVRKRVH
ncbi:hypothetical protein A3SI_01581 [Nitritalea halalkaliphila LW7]|uniref:Lipoprotein n=1 Tax=Nitritalea halalkaliphila LW7 TaxID=1189621 RepID=I5CA72_9BACT|nr:hypothetical protein A3SI_01581 [Nitritalea halalkaliphila LW7]